MYVFMCINIFHMIIILFGRFTVFRVNYRENQDCMLYHAHYVWFPVLCLLTEVFKEECIKDARVWQCVE